MLWTVPPGKRRLDTRGVALVEFAITLPILIYIMVGIIAYGQYFLLAHSLQQIANDAARATIAGLDANERRSLAADTVAKEGASLPGLSGGAIGVTTTETTDTVSVKLTIDAGAMPLFRTTLIPLPDATLTRTALVRQGGFV